MGTLTPYKLTIAAMIIIALLIVGVIEIVGTNAQALGFLSIAAPTITSLMTLFRGEQNAKAIDTAKSELAESHAVSTATIDQKLQELSALTDGLSQRAEERARLQGELAGRDFEAQRQRDA